VTLNYFERRNGRFCVACYATRAISAVAERLLQQVHSLLTSIITTIVYSQLKWYKSYKKYTVVYVQLWPTCK